MARSRASCAWSASSPRRPTCARQARFHSCGSRWRRYWRRSGYPPASHAGKALTNILNTFPRDELFQIGVEQLQAWSEGILDLETRPRVAVFARVDRFDRFVSLIIYVPRDRYNTGVRERIGALLAAAYHGRVSAFYPYFPEGPLVRVQFIIGRHRGPTPKRGARLARSRDRRDYPHLAGPAGAGHRHAWAKRRGAALPNTAAPSRRAIRRVFRRNARSRISSASSGWGRSGRSPSTSTARRKHPRGRLHAAVYRFGEPIALSERVPVLENLGFRAIDERSYHLKPRFADGRSTSPCTTWC